MVTWGKNAFVIPFPTSDGISNVGEDKYRIISSVNNNLIRINDVSITLDKGKIYEGDIRTNPIEIIAESPILVNQYKKTAKFSGSVVPASDPLMMTIPPKEQFLKECQIATINKLGNNNNLAFTEQYIFVVAPNNALNDCFVNNTRIPQNLFKTIRNSGYSYAIYSVGDGTFKFKSTEKCGLYVVGYGPANSYGYVGGMDMSVIADSSNPMISMNIDCFEAIGRITDSLITDSGIEKIEIVNANTKNVKVRLDNYFKGSPGVTFIGELIDPSQDGYFEIKVTDVWGYSTIYKGEIPGATLKFIDSEKEMVFDFDTTQIGLLKCRTLELTNYGKFDVTINQYDILNWGTYTIPPSTLPLVIPPGETKEIELCVHPTIVYDSLPDTLRIYNQCYGLDIPVKSSSSAINKDLDTKCDVIVHIKQTKVPSDYIFEEVIIDDIGNSGKIIFGIPQQIETKFVIYNAMGKAKKILTDTQYSPGFYEMWFSCEDLPNGVYFISLQTESFVKARKFLINK